MLFLGLVLHKAVWEVLKRRPSGPQQEKAKTVSPKVLIVKLGKVCVLLFLLVQTLFLDIFPITPDPFWVRWIGMGLFLLGLGTAVLGRIQLGENWVDLEEYQVLPEQSMVVQGVYRFIRHPIYSGDLILLFGLQLALNSWLVLGVVLLSIIVFRQAQAEEEILSRSFPMYVDYCKATKRFIPFVI